MRVGSFVLAAQFPGQGQGEALHRAVRSAEVAEEAGLDSVWLAEHHFVPYGACPSAVTLAALLLGRTRRIRVGTAVSVLPTAHPVALGEQAALLHLTSRRPVHAGRRAAAAPGSTWRCSARAWRRTRRGSRNHSICWCAGCANRRWRPTASGSRFREVPVVPRAVGGADGRVRAPRSSSPAPRRRACGWPPSADCRCCSACTAGTRRRPRWSPCGGSTRARRAVRRTRSAAPAHVSAGVCQIADRAHGRGGDAGEGDAGLAEAGARTPM